MKSQRENNRAESTTQNRPLPLTPLEIPSIAITQQEQTASASRAPAAADMTTPSVSSAIDDIRVASDAQADGGEVKESEVAGPSIVNTVPTSSPQQQQQQQPLHHEDVQSGSCSAVQADPQPPSPAAQGQSPSAVPNDLLDIPGAQDGEERKTLIEAIEQADRVMEGFGVRRS